MTIIMMMMMIMTDPFTTNLVVKGPVVKGSVVKGATSVMMVMLIMMVMKIALKTLIIFSAQLHLLLIRGLARDC